MVESVLKRPVKKTSAAMPITASPQIIPKMLQPKGPRKLTSMKGV